MEEFKDLQFEEETHTYTLSKEILPSVSSLISELYDTFDSARMSVAYAKKYGFTAEQVLTAWEGQGNADASRGTKVHMFGEAYAMAKYFQMSKIPLPSDIQELAVIQWWCDMIDEYPYIKPYKLEQKMYSKLFKYAGTADILLQDERDGKLIIADYKTNKDLYKNFGGKLMKLDGVEVLENNFNKYQCQFSFYQIMLEEAGYTVKSRVLIWLQKNEDTSKLYKNLTCEDMTHLLRKHLKTRGKGLVK